MSRALKRYPDSQKRMTFKFSMVSQGFSKHFTESKMLLPF